MPNLLAGETSPYLLQHAENPVAWQPWGPEALERARHEEKPILLSIGYAACHWCHVMAHESFEDAETAAIMNERFVNIKVDREERPDLDAIYMQAVQALTGHGGWPMTVFLTPDGAPFYGGTYYPPEDRHGLPSFRRVLLAVSDSWRNRRDAVNETAQHLRDAFRAAGAPREAGEVDARSLELAYRTLARAYDARHGGFSGAPKFPPSMALDFLLRYATRTDTAPAMDMVLETFRAMARGGIFDQVGGGLHRYSVDERWLVPHFEKMLYDNALFARLGVHLWQATGDTEVRGAVEATLDWALREMRSDDGGFYSSLDADSEGEEGKFYLWEPAEFDRVVGDDASVVRQFFGVAESGNFEGRTILNVPHDPAAAAVRLGLDLPRLLDIIGTARGALYAARASRVRPGCDDKVLAVWNALFLRALAEAARAFDRADYRDAAITLGRFLTDRLVRDSRVLRSYRNGVAKGPGFLEDQAATGLAFLDLYGLTFEPEWFTRASQLAESLVSWHYDAESTLLFDTPRDHEALITRPRETMDNATPSGISLAAELLLRVAELGGNESYRELTTLLVRQVSELLPKYPMGFGHLLGVADGIVFGMPELVIVGDPDSPTFHQLVRAAGERYVPSLVIAGGRPLRAGSPSSIALMRDRVPMNGEATAFVCRRYACEAPTAQAAVLADQLREVARATND
jgi:uncharacterized protein